MPNDNRRTLCSPVPRSTVLYPNYSSFLISGNFLAMNDKHTKKFEFPVSQSHGSYRKENTFDLHHPQGFSSYRTRKFGFTMYPINVIILYLLIAVLGLNFYDILYLLCIRKGVTILALLREAIGSCHPSLRIVIFNEQNGTDGRTDESYSLYSP